MSAPLATLIHGNLTLESGCDLNSYGPGDLNVANNAYINGSQNSTSPSSGTLIVSGGVGILKDTYLNGDLNVSSGTTNLAQTNIFTKNGPFSVFGSNGVNISVGTTSNFIVTGGNLSLISSNNSTIVQGGLNSNDAVQILASNSAGGIGIVSGQSGQINLVAGSGGIQELTSSGSINLIANNASASFQVNSSSSNQNLTLGVNGYTDSGVILQSSGINTTIPAIRITTTNTNGNIKIDNANGVGNGNITQIAGSGGYIYSGGPIQMSASGGSSYILVNSTSSNQNLTLGVNGATNSSLILQSAGINQAVVIQTINTAGSIYLTEPNHSAGMINLGSGAGGISMTTQNGGGINLTANGGISSFINQTTADNQNLTICVNGTSASSLILCSQGTNNQAILLSATGSGSGIFATASGPIQINSSDTTNGINIGTLTTVPVNIGRPTSTTTVLGNLHVQGTTTTVDSTIVKIEDNIIQLNTGPSGTADGGVAIERYQPANDNCLGDVVADVAENYNNGAYNLAQGGTTISITLSANDTEPNDYYDGWWIKIVSGTGACQVRRIKSYNAITKVALIYTTSDQTGILGNPVPVEGMDFTTAPDSTSVYALYPCAWILSIWDAQNSEYALVCSPMVSSSASPPIAHYVNLHINNLIANNISANTINGTTADFQLTVTLANNSTSPVSMTGFPYNYGIYFILVKPTISSNTRTHAIFAMGRINNNSCGQVVRLIGVKGTSGENLDVQWPANDYPQLLYRPAPGISSTTTYTIKVITV